MKRAKIIIDKDFIVSHFANEQGFRKDVLAPVIQRGRIATALRASQ